MKKPLPNSEIKARVVPTFSNPGSPFLDTDNQISNWDAPALLELERVVIHSLSGRTMSVLFTSNCYSIFRVLVLIGSAEIDSPQFIDLTEAYRYLENIRVKGVANPLAFLNQETVPVKKITGIILQGKENLSGPWMEIRERTPRSLSGYGSKPAAYYVFSESPYQEDNDTV